MFLHRLSMGRKEAGQGLVEYSLLLIFIAIIVIVVMVVLGQTIKEQYCHLMVGLAPLTDPTDICVTPMISLFVHEKGPTHLNLEAEVFDPDGDPGDPYGAIDRVEFYIDDADGSPVQTDYLHKYCLSGNTPGMPCKNFDTSGLSPGDHIFIVIVYDTDGNASTSEFTYHK